MSLEKKYLKSKPVCKVKFSLSGDQYMNSTSITLVGDFNDWDATATPLKKAKNGVWSVTLDLDATNSYQFRYLVDATTWVNDTEADGFVDGGMGAENSLLVL